ncbi:MAG: ribosome small subunit-dependent GTPase A [Oscillospiraceae bacterium]|nr:ribosome small subunit-dependent GTPase A [Oscillospiraceae bacterium]
MSKTQGIITSSVGGLYGVKTDDGVISCRARGLFRLKNVSPYVGDYVTVEYENDEPFIAEINQRKNELVRPPLANLDCVVITVSSCEPNPCALIIDKLTVILESKGIEPVLCFTKIDKKEALLLDVYREAGFTCFLNDNIEKINEYIKNKTSALIGNTGVGKTSLLNRMIPGLDLPTAEISKKLGRGKHTTRTVQLHELPGGGYIADTPGFSTVEGKFYGEIPSREIALYFREIAPLIGKCKFNGCTHTGEEGCEVAQNIHKSRYDSYVTIYKQTKKAENIY